MVCAQSKLRTARLTCEAIQSSKESKLASLNMGDNRIGPVGAKSAVAAMVAVTGGTNLVLYCACLTT